MKRFRAAIAFAGSVAALVAAIPLSRAEAQLAFGVTDAGNLVRWKSEDPENILRSDPIVGLQPGESLLAIDFRPATQVLYGLGSTGRIYRVSTQSVDVAMVSDGPMDPALSGTTFGMDFNAVADRIRIVSDAGQNLRINPHTLDDSVGDPLGYAPGDVNAGATANIVHAAHTNSFPSATGTTLYDIDATLDILVRQDPVAAGLLTTIGDLGLDIAVNGGFDIVGENDRAFAALQREGSAISEYFRVDLDTGKAALIGHIGDGLLITAMAVNPIPEPRGIALVLTAAVAWPVARIVIRAPARKATRKWLALLGRS